MKNQLPVVVILSIFLLVGCTSGSADNGISGLFEDLFQNIASIGQFMEDRSEDQLISFFKILFFFVVFAILHFAASKVGLPQNTSVVVAGAVSLMGTLVIPAEVIQVLAKTYATLFVIAAFSTVLYGIFWVNNAINTNIESGIFKALVKLIVIGLALVITNWMWDAIRVI